MSDEKHLIVIGGGAGTGKTTLARTIFLMHAGVWPEEGGVYDESLKLTVCRCGQLALFGRYCGSTQDGYGNILSRTEDRDGLHDVLQLDHAEQLPVSPKYLVAEGIAFGNVKESAKHNRAAVYFGLTASALERAQRVQGRSGRVTKASVHTSQGTDFEGSARCYNAAVRVFRTDILSPHRIALALAAELGGIGSLEHAHFLSVYERVTAPAAAEYERVTAPAAAEYKRVTAPAAAEYKRVRSAADAEYKRVRSAAAAEYARDLSE